MAETTESQHAHRKDEHLAIATHQYTTSETFADVRVIHQGLPELAEADVDLHTMFGRLSMATPFYIEAMTGGSARTGRINQQLAEVANATGLAMAVGSQSIALAEPQQVATFNVVRQANPNGLVFANLGAGHTIADAERVVDMLEANALELHINTAQEAVMPEGDTDFHWLAGIEALVSALPVPVIVKEVGFGMSRETAAQLKAVGVQYVNVSGRGGTNFATIENERRHAKELTYMADWGQTTPESLLEVAQTDLHIAASGGVQTPLDVLKALMLGADCVGVAGQFLHVLMHDGQQALLETIVAWQQALRTLYTLTGAATTPAVRDVPFILSPTLLSYKAQRHL
ncbi:type 2 isopentenyl-diphosphate Delta-isomerase [Furfurilactobacillus entadae]|uniref:type 2 isopentenyl-diphosphate Delta-isomerase n=1 Tax=Furfurilactobacillus entadae TaxID=2922307 RepID=UPI0035EDC0EF